MGNLGYRYAGLLGAVMTLFITFVACGSQLYKVSLHGDTDTSASHVSGMTSSADNAQDPSSPTYGLHAPSGWSKVPMHYRVDSRMSLDQVRGLQAAMKTWELATGRSLFIYDGTSGTTTGDSFKDLYSSLNDIVNGQYLDDHWGKTGKPEQVLATTIWNNDPGDTSVIITADIRFNNQFYVFGDSLTIKAIKGREVVDIQTLATHELGHWLGLAHMSATVDPDSIMVPSLYIGEGLSNRHVSRGDLARIQKIYGCQGTACDLDETLAKIDQLAQSTVASAGASTKSASQPSAKISH